MQIIKKKVPVRRFCIVSNPLSRTPVKDLPGSFLECFCVRRQNKFVENIFWCGQADVHKLQGAGAELPQAGGLRGGAQRLQLHGGPGSVADPGSGAFLTLDPDPGSGICFFPDLIPDPNPIFFRA